MSLETDIDALLGLDTKEIVNNSKKVKNELITLSEDNLSEKIISETSDMIDITRTALGAVLDEVNATPNDAELIESASKLIQAQTGLVDALSKLHLNKEKHKQQVELAKMRIEADMRINTDNNTTKMLLSRQEVMAQLMSDAKKIVPSSVIDS